MSEYTGDPPPGIDFPPLAPLTPGVGIPSQFPPTWIIPAAFLQHGPQAFQCGPRRPAPGEKGFFLDEEAGTILAGVVERIEIEYDIDEVIVQCSVNHGGIEMTLYEHSQCFYYNEDAVAYGVNHCKEKNSDD